MDPVHQCVDVFWSGEFGGTFVFDTVFPKVFVSVDLSEMDRVIDGYGDLPWTS